MVLNHLLTNAYEEFSQSLHSIGARFVLWGSFKNAAELQQHYFLANNKKFLLDGRRTKSLSTEEIVLKELVEYAASEAEEFFTWARSHGRQPLIREILISYCSAFEACLKNVALVLALAKNKKQGLQGQVFVPGDEFRRTLRDIQAKWKNLRGGDLSTAESFFESEILSAASVASHLKFLPMTAPEWLVCRAAFQARNAVVHQLGRPTITIEIAGKPLPAGWEIELSTKQVQEVRKAFLQILWPISPLAQL